MEKPIQCQFCGNANLEHHKSFFRSLSSHEGVSWTASPPRAGEQWEIVAEWDAAHQVPLAGDKRKVNPPALVAWSPKGDRLFTSCDAFGLTVWEVSALGWDSRARKRGADVNPAAYGYPIRLFVAQRGDSLHVLQETESYQHAYYDIRDGEARLVCKGKNERFWGWGRGRGHSTQLDRNEGIDPWRPGSDRELAIVQDYSSLKLVDVTKLPDRPVLDKNWLIDFFVWIIGRVPEPSTKIPAHEAPAQQWIAFDSLGARDKTIFGFHFHPGGEYIAVTTGDWDDKQRRTIHIVHIASALIVASVPAKAEALGWSPGGRFLLCRRTAESNGKENMHATVWDGMRFEESPEPPDDLLSQPWAMKALASNHETILSADGRRLLMSSGTVVSSALRKGPRVRPGEELAKIASDQFAHAAWHPSDPHCFVTVGGEASEEYPDTYSRDHDRPHGRLLRIWRLTS